MAKRNKDFPDKTEEFNEQQRHDFINAFDDEFFWVKDESGSIRFSENLSEVTGFTPVELKSLEDIIHEEDISNYRKIKYETLDNLKTDFDIEFRITTKDDKIKWLRESVKIFYNANEKVVRTIGRVADVTRKKIDEINLNEVNNELKDQNIAKDSFLNLLSHDLRSPFTSILGFTEILLKESSLTEAERNEYLTHIYSSSEKLLQLINYLLDWSRLRAGKLKVEQQKINLQSLVYNCVSSLTGAAIRKNIEIKVEGDKSLKILGDERLLNIVITNIISNAIKFSKGESKVLVKTGKFNDDFAELIVIDEGIGIPDISKNKLFKIENMLSTTGTAGEKGTGFSLTLSKEIIEKHGAKLWFYSEEGKGSEFHITIPSSPNVILIIETDAEKLNELASFVKKNFNDYKVITAINPYEAINYSDSLQPSIIILSHALPLMNGAQIIETITRGKDHSELKVIVLYDSFAGEIKNIYKKFSKVIFIEKTAAENEVIKALRDLTK